VVFVEVDTVVVLTTGVTATTRVLAVLANTTVTGADVTSLVTVVVKTGRLQNKKMVKICCQKANTNLQNKRTKLIEAKNDSFLAKLIIRELNN